MVLVNASGGGGGPCAATPSAFVGDCAVLPLLLVLVLVVLLLLGLLAPSHYILRGLAFSTDHFHRWPHA